MNRMTLKHFCLLVCLGPFLALLAGEDPVLMRVGGREVLRSEFEYFACRTGADGLSRDSLRQLARLFVDFRLKVQAAEAAGLDTSRAFCDELARYRAGLSRTYLTDSAALSRALLRRYKHLQELGPRIRMKQIYRRLPQNVTPASLRDAVAQMDSVYDVLKRQGPGEFDALLERFSDDREAHWLYGIQASAEMQDTLLALRPGACSQPFFTPRGLHIVQVLERVEVPPFASVRDSLLQACPQCVDEAARALAENLRQAYGFPKSRSPLSDAQVRTIMFAEYDSLEHRVPDFRLAVQFHRDTLLARAVTRRMLEQELPEAELAAYFERHRTRYHWDAPRFRGIVLRCTGRRVAKRVRKMLKQLPPADWQDAIRLLFNSDGTQVEAEQGTFIPGQNPYVDERIFRRGKAPQSADYPHVVLVGRKQKGPVDYHEVLERLLADYRTDQEEHWMRSLRSSVKVEINQEVLKTVNKQ